MYRMNPPTSIPDMNEPRPRLPAVRSYEQIARILAQRGNLVLSAMRVGQICRAAEEKIASALLTSQEIRRRLRYMVKG